MIGRSKDCDIQVADPNVSRRHAELRQEGATLLARRPRLDERVEVKGKRVKRLKLEDGTRFTVGSTELDVRPGAAVTVLASAQVETTLLVLKIAFLVLLYLFIWRIVRSAARDLRLPQESMILAPAAGGRSRAPRRSRRRARPAGSSSLQSPALGPGDVFTLDSHPLTVGRGATNDCRSPSDEYASTRHARFEPRRDGVWSRTSARRTAPS